MASNRNRNLAEINTSEKTRSDKKGWTKKKIVAASIIGGSGLAFVIFMCIVIFGKLGAIRPIESTEEEKKVVGVCGGYEVKYEELRYISILNKESMEATYGEYESLDKYEREYFLQELEKRVNEDIKSIYVVLSLCDNYGIDIESKDANEYVQNSIESMLKNDFGGNKDKYIDWLSKNCLTDSFLRLMYRVDYLESALLDHFIAEKIDIEYDADTKKEFIEYVMDSEDWVRTIHVYYPAVHPWTISGNVPPEILEVDADYINKVIAAYDAKKLVGEAYDRIMAAESDEERFRILQKSEVAKAPATSNTISGNGLYFTYGQVAEVYEKAAFELDIYGASEIIELDAGYYIIMRLPLDKEDVQKRVDDLLGQYQYASLKRQLDAQDGKIAFEGNEYYSQISLVDIE